MTKSYGAHRFKHVFLSTSGMISLDILFLLDVKYANYTATLLNPDVEPPPNHLLDCCFVCIVSNPADALNFGAAAEGFPVNNK